MCFVHFYNWCYYKSGLYLNFRNKELIHKENLTGYPFVDNVTDTIYDSYMSKHFPDGDVNGTDFKDCNLERELDSAAAGTGLAFVVFTQAIVELPMAPFWSIIFFLMLLALGLGSQIGTMEGVVNTVFECSYFKGIRKEVLTGKCLFGLYTHTTYYICHQINVRKPVRNVFVMCFNFLLAFVCFASFCCGLIFVSGAGEYWVSLFDGYASTTGKYFRNNSISRSFNNTFHNKQITYFNCRLGYHCSNGNGLRDVYLRS